MKIMNFNIFIDSFESIDLTSKKVINTINAHSYMVSKSDKKFKEALQDSNILIPDGSGIVLAARQIYGTSIKKISGSDLHEFLLDRINRKHGKIFYLGSSISTLEKILAKVKKDFPNITLESYSPPFKTIFSHSENRAIVKKINTFEPDVLFVGMTAPKQEKWLHDQKKYLNFKIACSIGAVFDFYAETIKRPNIYLRKFFGESLPRFVKEPKRLWRRNLISAPLFIIEILLFKFKILKND